jgi:hypothetical protein
MALLTDFLGVPGLTALVFTALGGLLLTVPRRILILLSDSFALGTREHAASRRRKLVARLAGAVLIGYAIFLAANTLRLADAFYHSGGTPERAPNCSAPLVPKGNCPTSHPSR